MRPSNLEQLCHSLKLPTVRLKACRYAEKALSQQKSYEDYLIDLLTEEWEIRQKRGTQRRIKAAQFPFLKTLEGFDFNKTPELSPAFIRQLTSNQYIKEARPVIFLGEPGTGKTHLAIALGIAAAEEKYRVRFISAAELANHLMEAKDARNLSKVVLRYATPDVLILDELGYLPLSKAEAELLFQVFSKRQEHKPIIVTTNLPFSEWINIFPEPRLCKAVIDRLTFKAHIVDTGQESVRLSESLKWTKD